MDPVPEMTILIPQGKRQTRIRLSSVAEIDQLLITLCAAKNGMIAAQRAVQPGAPIEAEIDDDELEDTTGDGFHLTGGGECGYPWADSDGITWACGRRPHDSAGHWAYYIAENGAVEIIDQGARLPVHELARAKGAPDDDAQVSREREVAASAPAPGRPTPVETAEGGGAAPATAVMAVAAPTQGAAPADKATVNGRPFLRLAGAPVDLTAAAAAVPITPVAYHGLTVGGGPRS